MIPAEQVSSASGTSRILLVDTLRGLALVAMATYHFTWDLEFFGYIDPGTATQGFFRIYARSIASSFLFLAGVSLVLAHAHRIHWSSFWKRFMVVAGAALAISVATLFAVPNEWIYFGILHNIALSSLIGIVFVRMPPAVTLVAAVVIVAAAIVDHSIAPGSLRSEIFDTRLLSWIGFAETPPRSNDYVPLFPWTAALLAGMAFARLAQMRNWLQRLAALQSRSNLLSVAGRHSLAIYLVHQPVLIALLYLFSLVHPAPAPDIRASYIGSCEMGCRDQGNEPGLCARFCGCTADKLAAQTLLPQLQAGLLALEDERVEEIANQCSMEAAP